jgi:hypothetical protein
VLGSSGRYGIDMQSQTGILGPHAKRRGNKKRHGLGYFEGHERILARRRPHRDPRRSMLQAGCRPNRCDGVVDEERDLPRSASHHLKTLALHCMRARCGRSTATQRPIPVAIAALCVCTRLLHRPPEPGQSSNRGRRSARFSTMARDSLNKVQGNNRRAEGGTFHWHFRRSSLGRSCRSNQKKIGCWVREGSTVRRSITDLRKAST